MLLARGKRERNHNGLTLLLEPIVIRWGWRAAYPDEGQRDIVGVA